MLERGNGSSSGPSIVTISSSQTTSQNMQLWTRPQDMPMPPPSAAGHPQPPAWKFHNCLVQGTGGYGHIGTPSRIFPQTRATCSGDGGRMPM